MNANASDALEAKSVEENWSVVVLYEDRPTRDRALALCDRLVRNFWSEVEFDFHWWRTDFLDDPQMAQIAAANAKAADIFIFSSSPESSISPMFLRWCQTWIAKRELNTGMFLDLTDAAAQTSLIVQQKQAQLRNLADQANLEYFNRVPPPLGGDNLNSPQSLETRTHQFTAVLDEILHHIPPPTHHGLNE